MNSFEQTGLSKPILKALGDLGFEKPSDIQAQAIPHLINGNTDLIGLAQTGTGKTAAFGLPVLELIDPYTPYTQALILAPTRELGQQIAEQLELFSKYMNDINILCVYGGANIANQLKALKKPQQVVIATPGRLIDLLKRKAIRLNKLSMLVLDEADEMLNMGFKEDIDYILSHTPEEKLTWLFSATMPKEIRRIVSTYMVDPVEVKVNTKEEVNTNITHEYVVVKQAHKSRALMRFLDLHGDMRGVVFCRTKRDTQDLSEQLLSNGYKADALHGDLSQAQRERVMKRFKNHDLQVLIATDVAARGIDVKDLSHVIHFALPDDAAYYTHRSGRTARAGKKGVSLALINFKEKGRLFRFEKSLGIAFERVEVPSTAEIANIRMANWAHRIGELPVHKTLDQSIFEEVDMILGNLSREEILAKVIIQEMKNLQLGDNVDLNDRGPSKSSGSSHGGQRGSRDNKRRRNRSGGGSNHRGQGGGNKRSGSYNSNSSRPPKRRRPKKR